MVPSTPDEFQHTRLPPRKGPPLLVLVLLLTVGGMVAVGITISWLVAFLVPVAVFSILIATNVVIRLVRPPMVVVEPDGSEEE